MQVRRPNKPVSVSIKCLPNYMVRTVARQQFGESDDCQIFQGTLKVPFERRRLELEHAAFEQRAGRHAKRRKPNEERLTWKASRMSLSLKVVIDSDLPPFPAGFRHPPLGMRKLGVEEPSKSEGLTF